MPHVNCEVSATASEDVFAVGRGTEVLHLIGVGNQTHGLVRVSVQGQLDQSDDLFSCLVEHVLFSFAIAVLVQQFQFCDLTAVSRTKASAPR